MDDDLDEFFESLSLESSVSNVTTPPPVLSPTLSSLSELELQNLALTELIKTVTLNNNVMEEVKDMIIMGADADYIQSYAGVAKANADALKEISQFALQREKLRVQKEVKSMDIEGKKEIEQVRHRLGMDGKTVNNNFLVMGREEVFDRLFPKKVETIDAIEVESQSQSQSSDTKELKEEIKQ